MKTQIKKFLWFDITPRKHLYDELDECYRTISNNRKNELKHLEKIDDIKGVQKEISWGSQIRSYTFMPYTLVKDHRTGCEVGNVEAVMNGEIDSFIDSYLKSLV